MQENSDDKYLSLFKVANRRYIIGIHQEGISVVKQQKRALKIFQALVERNIIKCKPEFKIGIIGGGIAGVTFADACIRTNNTVFLFEEKSELLHFQKYCCTRTLHPNVYEWPAKGSQYPFARLPILSWKTDIAHSVVKEIEDQFELLCQDARTYNDGQKVEIIRGAKIYSVTTQFGNEWIKCSMPKNLSKPFDLIIYAVGYGLEKNINPAIHSYWRNDTYSQSVLGTKPGKYIISGARDGGLMDLFRLVIPDFSYEKFFKVMKSKSEIYKTLIYELRRIVTLVPNKKIDDSLLFHEFSRLNSDNYSYIIDALLTKDKVRNNVIILNDVVPFSSVLDIKVISVINAFIVFLIQQEGLFEYVQGTLEVKDEIYSIGGVEYLDYHVIIRHGTDRNKIFENLIAIGEDKNKLEALRVKQEKTKAFGNTIPSLDFAGISKILFDRPNKNIEFVSKETAKLFRTKTQEIFDDLFLKKRNEGFRLTMYRIVFIDGIPYVQQVAPYFRTTDVATKIEIDVQNIGQIFPIKRGNVGLSARRKIATLIIREDDQAFRTIVADLNLGEGFVAYNYMKSFFSYPILAKFNSTFISNLVFFIEAESRNFFNERTLQLIHDHLISHSVLYNTYEKADFSVVPGEDVSPETLDIAEDISHITSNVCWKELEINQHIEKYSLKEFNDFEAII